MVKAQDILVVIYAPQSGQVVQGQVPVDVGIEAEGYSKIELQFAYSKQDNANWFLIAESEQIPFDGILTLWDTTAITDGEYDLRLVAKGEGKESIIFLVQELRVRNYSPIETETPTPILTTTPLSEGRGTLQVSPTVTDLPPTITPFPTNPAIFTFVEFGDSASLGGGITVVVFIALGLYIVLRNSFKRGG